jgi:hypothetical protein
MYFDKFYSAVEAPENSVRWVGAGYIAACQRLMGKKFET